MVCRMTNCEGAEMENLMALLSCLPKKSISDVQLLPNCILMKTRRWGHVTLILKSLRWLPVCFRINFKTLLMLFMCLKGLGPSCLSELFLPYEPTWSLCSSDSCVLVRSGHTLTVRHFSIIMALISGTGCRRTSGPHRTPMFLRAGSRLTFLAKLLTDYCLF